MAPKRKDAFQLHDLPQTKSSRTSSSHARPTGQHNLTVFDDRSGELKSTQTSIKVPLRRLEQVSVQQSGSTSSHSIASSIPVRLDGGGDHDVPGGAEGEDDETASDLSDLSDGESDGDEKGKEKKGKGKRKADLPLLAFYDRIDDIVAELMRLEGPGTPSDAPRCSTEGCTSTVSAGSMYRCTDCGPSASLFCKGCLVREHQYRPYDRPEVWTGTHFLRTSLKSLGLRVQLGHAGTQGCPYPQRAFNDAFVIVAPNGIHEIGLDFCGCPGSPDHVVQLLRHRLFPATVKKPKTAATFSALKLLQMLTFTAKISCQEFTRAMDRLTNNTGTEQYPNRYRSTLRMLRVWRHTRLMKRFARGYDPAGWRATASGACAVICPACPHPNINLPANWMEMRQKEAFLYWLFVALDANFRLKRKNVSNDHRDPGLIQGFSYILEDSPFREYLLKYTERIIQDKSTCNDHDAIKSSSLRGGSGYAASGMGIAQCSRHDMKRPTGMGDLQKGERYINMDCFFLSTIQHDLLKKLIVSYDIACQWHVKLMERCKQYEPNVMTSQSPPETTFLVPKFHLPAHVEACRVKYSFNYAPGVGRTDGEAPERGWAASNDLAYSTREMGPGSRRDTLDDCFGDHNWVKVTRLADALHEKATEALIQREAQVLAFREFDGALPTDWTSKWTAMVQKWESDPKCRNPYQTEAKSQLSYNAVRLTLAEEDKIALGKGEDVTVHDDVTPSMFIFQGLEIEDSQRILDNDTKDLGPHSTDLQRARVLERANLVRRKYSAWCTLRDLYMPSVAPHRKAQIEQGNVSDDGPVQNLPLYLPSDIIATIPIPKRLAHYEFRFRLSQADSALTDLRAHLILRTQMHHSKKIFTHGTHAITRSHGLLQEVEKKIRLDAALYNNVRQRLVTLGRHLQKNDWEASFRPLEKDDIRGMTSEYDPSAQGTVLKGKEREKVLGDGRKAMSWIWRTGEIGDKIDDASESVLRIEWCKARARAHRWQEECHLLGEEMRRTAEYFRWEQRQWLKHANDTEREYSAMVPPSQDKRSVMAEIQFEDRKILLRGKVAYAHRQAENRLESVVGALVPPGTPFSLVELH
ncbi:hypothetical protein DFP72DRAFT_993649 [Ephemerocybe angulata]|uniref:CxC2-like cysteine cluster KDZ transposase-associated domain-containing protein n=1 Tax=Ephemerocybe angulata TaxID=980116 RepID=A0A8H6HBB5_9AGAR|nr:hypothetical protein DFP72DRAFT_993649 [Tulosesus angulatus]